MQAIEQVHTLCATTILTNTNDSPISFAILQNFHVICAIVLVFAKTASERKKKCIKKQIQVRRQH